MTDLRHELVRIAEQAPDVDPSGAWERGRRARARVRVLTGVLAAAALAVVGGSVALLVPPDRSVDPVSPGPEGAAVPSRLWPVPDRLIDHSFGEQDLSRWDPAVAVTDLAVGRGAAAFSVGEAAQLPVVVAAADGAYHLLDLPGWIGTGILNTDAEGALLALSPDGRSLAYAWWDPAAPLDRPMPAGVRVLDLGSGDLRTVHLRGGNGVQVKSLVWSPDSRWVGWHGTRTRSWTPHSSAGGPTVAGVIGPRAVGSRPVRAERLLAVGGDGTVVAARVRDSLLLAGQRVAGTALAARASSASPSPASTSIMLGKDFPCATCTSCVRPGAATSGTRWTRGAIPRAPSWSRSDGSTTGTPSRS